jgi:hypothetical protein
MSRVHRNKRSVTDSRRKTPGYYPKIIGKPLISFLTPYLFV